MVYCWARMIFIFVVIRYVLRPVIIQITQLTTTSLFSAHSFTHMQYWLPSIMCYSGTHRTSSLPTYSNPLGLSVHSWTLTCGSSQPCVTHTLPWVTHLLCETWHGIFGGCVCIFMNLCKPGHLWRIWGFIKRIRVHAQRGQRESMIWACGLKCESVCDGEGDCFRQVLKCNRLRHVACSVSCC